MPYSTRVETLVFEAMDADESVSWLLDDTGIPKKGKHSGSVSHQYCGQPGKQGNCQVAASLSLSNDTASVPINYRLYVPRTEDETARHRRS